ncbi:zinc finger protein 250-like isoform X2 [Stegodyphus dumicola]|uniref:zinc finger protein 250-like isoform X2 n=1 Tax=Stegodyphus dumicola TaxID=202533 RepID=UPI0015AC73BE|nr:zinc finger protein 250-like isoform X2 [Stegodyphus dumicola]
MDSAREEHHICLVCRKSFRRKFSLNVHMRIHTEKSHVCEVCQASFNQKKILSRHMLIHTGEKPHVCEIILHDIILDRTQLRSPCSSRYHSCSKVVFNSKKVLEGRWQDQAESGLICKKHGLPLRFGPRCMFSTSC